MKIRTDFVTNSSSSSFIMVRVTSEKLTNMINKYETLIQEKDSDWYEPSLFYVNDDDNSVTLQQEECWAEVYMEEENLEGLVDAVINVFDEIYVGETMREEMTAFINEIQENKEEIIENIEEIEITDGNMGWQGDDESRFYPDWYEEEHLEILMEEIANENNCTVEEVDGEMFSEHVCCMTSIEESTIHYNKETGKITRTRNTELM